MDTYWIMQYFNPRSREGSDFIPLPQRKNKNISIHAPARGATAHGKELSPSHAISIHAPARGATRFRKPYRVTGKFQSTLPRGERLTVVVFRPLLLTISIHAPARGATMTALRNAGWSYEFQSTLPRGERRRVRNISISHMEISIHAPARGATEIPMMSPLIYTDFNPRSREGSDRRHSRIVAVKHNFNPRSREGSDDMVHITESQKELFQSTLPRGERLQFYLKFTLCF